MSKIRKDERVTVAQSFLSGGIAGVASRTITSPLDVVKILAQVGTKETKNGFIKSFINIHQREGTKAFWKGNLVACYRLFPYNAIQFATYYKLKNSFADARGNISSFNALASGSLAGVFATIMTYPLDMVKTRLTVAHADKNISKYSGIKDCIMKIYKEEGAKAFYKGMNTSIIGVIPFAGGTFMAYEFLNKAWAKPRDKMTPLENFVNGCLAAAFAQTFSFPFDTIRKKLQAQSHVVFEDMKPDVAFNGMLDAFKQTIRKHGVLGLWRGTTANLAKVVPYAGIMFAVFEQSRRMFMWWNGYTSSPFVDRPIQGVDQNLTPTELKLWYEEKKRRESA